MAFTTWQATVMDDAGNAVPSPTVTVRNASDDSLADIFNIAGSAKTNPFDGTTEGFVQFQVYPGRYKIEGAKDASTAQTWYLDASDGVFTTRAAAVAAVSAGWVPEEGREYTIEGLRYIGSDGATDISDLGGLLPSGDVTHEHWPLTETGFKAAAAYCSANKITLNIRVGDWSISQTTTTLVNQSNLHIKLASGAVLTVTGSSAYHEFCRGANVMIEGGKLILGVGTSGTYVLALRNADGFTLKDCEVVGDVVHSSGSTYTKQFHLCSLSDTTDHADILVEGCTIDTVQYLFLKTNSATSTTENVTLRGCTILNAYKAPGQLNSPAGSVVNYTVEGNSFLTHLGESVGDPGHYVGMATGSGCKIINNYFAGSIEQVMHFEEDISSLVIEGNIAEVSLPNTGNAALIAILTNFNIDGATISTPYGVSIKGNVLRNIGGSQYGIGIYAYDHKNTWGRYSLADSVIEGNIVEGVSTGYRLELTPGSGVVVRQNTASDCARGFRALAMVGGVYDGNTSVRCTYGVVGSNGAGFKDHTFIDCTNLTGVIASSYMSLHNFRVVLPTQDIAAASPVAMKVMDGVTATARLSGTLHTAVGSDANFTTYRDELEPLNWDGSTLGTPTPTFTVGANCSVAVTQGSDQLTQTITLSSDETNCSAVITFEGFAHLRPPVVA